jgi:hypothetical protein
VADPEFIERLAERITRRGWITPAVLLLEIARPFSFIASQGLFLCQPLAGFLNIDRQVGEVADLLADRSSVDRLVACLEQGAEHKDHR